MRAREYVGTPYRKKGRQIGKGVDCVGLILCVASDLAIKDKNGDPFHPLLYIDYPDEPLGDDIERGCKERLIEKSSLKAIEAGDVLAMRIPPEKAYRRAYAKEDSSKRATHVAIVSIVNGTFGIIHAYNSVRKRVVEHTLDAKWLRRITGVFSFPGVTG